MNVKLISHHLIDRPDWIVIKQSIPLGTIYEVWGFQKGLHLIDMDTNERRIIDAYYVKGNGDIGFLPCELFEAIKEES